MNDFVLSIDEMIYYLSDSLSKSKRTKEDIIEVFESSQLDVRELKMCLKSSVQQELYELSAIIRDVINLKDYDPKNICRNI